MKTDFTRLLLAVTCLSLTVAACNTIDPDTSFDPQPGPLAIAFDNVVGDQDLQLGTGTYRNGTGESFTPTVFNYYVSNLKLLRADGSAYVVPQDSSYFLIREDAPASQRILLSNVPAGDYTAVQFVIGVDSLRSTMEFSRRTGVLDPGGDHTNASGMFWAWNSGYIFMKLEGESPSAPLNATGIRKFVYHIGLFGAGGTLNNVRTVQPVAFGSDKVTVEAGTLPTVHLQTDVLKIFDGSTTVSIAARPVVMLADYSKYVADNYARMVHYKNTTVTAVATTK